eukprot:707817-Pelagomonas_calceolata.AAC.1
MVCAVAGITGGHIVKVLSFKGVFFAHWVPAELATRGPFFDGDGDASLFPSITWSAVVDAEVLPSMEHGGQLLEAEARDLVIWVDAPEYIVLRSIRRVNGMSSSDRKCAPMMICRPLAFAYSGIRSCELIPVAKVLVCQTIQRSQE